MKDEAYIALLKGERAEMLHRHTILTNDNCPYLAEEVYEGIERINKLIRNEESGGFFGW